MPRVTSVTHTKVNQNNTTTQKLHTTTSETDTAKTTTSSNMDKYETTEKASVKTSTTKPIVIKTYHKYYTDQDAIDIAKVLNVECGGIPSDTEKACVAWTILNRVDNYGSDVYSVVRAPYQYAFYEDTEVRESLLSLSYDVLERWSREKNGSSDVGRVLPKEYMFFEGDGYHNYFKDGYGGSYNVWDYSIQSPYDS